jgi:DNA polymerase
MTTERYIRDPRFHCHGAGIQIATGKPKWITGDLLPKVYERINWEEVALVGHNLQFDASILAWKYGVVPKLYIDTLGMARAMIGPHSARKGLKYCAEVLCGMTKMDELAKAYNIPRLPPNIEERIADYTVGQPRWNPEKEIHEAGDVVLTRAILDVMLPHFPKKELLALDWTVRAFACPRLYLDTEMLGFYIEEVRDQKAFAMEEVFYNDRAPGFTYYAHYPSKNVFRDAVGAVHDGQTNPITQEHYLELRREGWTADRLKPEQQEYIRAYLASNPQFATVLESFGVTPPTKVSPKTGKVSFAFAKTDEGLKELLDHENPMVQAIVAARLQVKSTIEETRAVKYQDASLRGAWPVGYNFAGAQVTLRDSGNDGGGGNPQNLKRGGTLRKAIYAPEGFLLGAADLSQIEARITLWCGMQITGPDGEEAKALEVMRQGGDIYGWFGTKIYGYPITKEDTPLERQIAKSAVLGLGFGMGAARFIEYCKQSGIKGIDERFAEDIVKLYRSTFPGIRKFWSQCNKAINMMLDGAYDVALPFDGVGLVRTGTDPLFNDSGILLPSGFYIKYPDLQKDADGEITYRDGNKRAKLFGGKVCENIVQAVAAGIMRAQRTEVNKVYPVVLCTHDELVSMVPEDDASVAEYLRYVEAVMTRDVDYLPGLPMGIEVHLAIRYGDAK